MYVYVYYILYIYIYIYICINLCFLFIVTLSKDIHTLVTVVSHSHNLFPAGFT